MKETKRNLAWVMRSAVESRERFIDMEVKYALIEDWGKICLYGRGMVSESSARMGEVIGGVYWGRG